MADQPAGPGPAPPAGDRRADGHRPRRRVGGGWLVAAGVFAAVFIAGIIISAVDESRGGPADLQAVLLQADAQQVVVCGVLAGALAAHGTGHVTLDGPRAAADGGDSAVVVLAAGGVPPGGVAAGASVEVSATVQVRGGAGGSQVADLTGASILQVVQSCPAEIVPLSR